MAIIAKRPLASSALSFRVLQKNKIQKYVFNKKISNTMSKLTHAQRHEKIRNMDNRMCKPACSTMYIHVL